MAENVVWGMDMLESIPPVVLDKPVSELSLDEVRAFLRRFDVELSALEEESDLSSFYERINLPNPREFHAEEAATLKKEINTAGNSYRKLLGRFKELAQTPLDVRAVNLRERQSLFDRCNDDPTIDQLKKKVRAAYQTKSIVVEGKGSVPLTQLAYLFYDPNPKIREAAYRAYRHLGDIEELIHEEIAALRKLVNDQSTLDNFLALRADYCEVQYCEVQGIDALEIMMRKFVERTKPVYEELFRELISPQQVKPWDVDFIILKKDPFRSAPVEQNAGTLLAIAVDMLKRVGYDPALIDDVSIPSAGVLIDIEERKEKYRGATSYYLGAFSHGKHILLYNPEPYKTEARSRWTVFPHELGHAVHYAHNRKASEVHGAVFFIENTAGMEVIPTCHEALAMDPHFLREHISSVDEAALHKWNLFHELTTAYRNIRVTLGELALHRDPSKACEGFYNARLLTNSELVEPDHDLYPAYVANPRVFNMPGYSLAYVLAAFYALPLMHTIRERVGTLISDQTAHFLMEHIMIGNMKSMHNRVVEATGTVDIVTNAINYFNDAVR